MAEYPECVECLKWAEFFKRDYGSCFDVYHDKKYHHLTGETVVE